VGALIFTALLGLTRAFVAEREQGLFDALVLAPCDRSALWLGKAIAVFAFLVAAEVVALPAFAIFFSGLDGRTVAAVALADVGIATVGTLLGAMAVAGRARELLLPLLFLPLAVPIVVGGVGGYLWFLALYDLLFGVLAWATFSTSSPRRSRLPCAREAGGPDDCPDGCASLIFSSPTDADRASQRIFYFHVPIEDGVRMLWLGAWKALRVLCQRRGRRPGGYVVIHQGVISGHSRCSPADLAKAAGRLVSWSENQLVLFLVLFLFYCAYFMRFSVEPGPARANIPAVYSLFGILLVPVSCLANRLSQHFIHPVVFTSHGPQMTGTQFLVFCVSLAAMLSLFATFYSVELAGKRIDASVRELRRLLA
jgi:heme exporter protein B